MLRQHSRSTPRIGPVKRYQGYLGRYDVPPGTKKTITYGAKAGRICSKNSTQLLYCSGAQSCAGMVMCAVQKIITIASCQCNTQITVEKVPLERMPRCKVCRCSVLRQYFLDVHSRSTLWKVCLDLVDSRNTNVGIFTIEDFRDLFESGALRLQKDWDYVSFTSSSCRRYRSLNLQK